MSAKHEKVETAAERESRLVAESARETEWRQPSFMREMFLGRFRLSAVHPYPMTEQERPEFREFFDRLKRFMAEEVDSAAIDATGEYPPEVIDGLKRMGAFGMKIPRKYGGLGMNQVEYSKIMEMLGSADGNISALLSAHQSIGVPQPLKMFGTEAQKQKYLPRCAAGAISAFALTEDAVGSDPARLATTIELTPEGDAYILNGSKLWCTNGTIAELLVVMARNQKKKISALVVETSWPGVTIEHRCRFMGLKALANAVIRFDNVRVPRENLIGKEGQGLKIALVTLNTGRLSLPAGCLGGARMALKICREWAAEREQWGQAIGKHEAITHKLADMAAMVFAMEAVSNLASEMADRGNYDIRLEAAAAKEYISSNAWRIVDETMQIRGGRGYETEHSLAARGEKPIPVERAMRDSRINTIFEGSSEIMHLFMAREAVDRHLQVAGMMIDPKKSLGQKLSALPRIAAFYGTWYPTRWLGWGHWPRFGEFGKLARHVRFVERTTRKLSRAFFHGMVIHGARLQRKQASLFRLIDVANELLAMSAAVARAQRMVDNDNPDARHAVQLTDLFCRGARRRVKQLFRDLWRNDDVRKYGVGRTVLDGRHTWLERDIVLRAADTAPAAVRERVEEPDVSPVG